MIDGIFSSGRLRGADRLEGPVAFVFGAFGDPAAQRFRLGGGDDLFRLRRRHDLVRVVAEDAREGLAELGRAGDDGLRSDRRGPLVETDVALERFFIGPVALETLVVKDGPDVAIEIELFLRREEHGRKKQQEKGSVETKEHAPRT